MQITNEEQGTSPDNPECKHNYPIVVTKTQTGCHARCLKCLTEGPERPFSVAARLALVSGRMRATGERNRHGDGQPYRVPFERHTTLSKRRKDTLRAKNKEETERKELAIVRPLAPSGVLGEL